MDSADHFLFKVIGLLPATLDRLVHDDRIPPLFFSLFSLLDIALLHRLARKLGAGSDEAFLAAFLLALSSSFLYYSRHVLPYDMALAFGLGAITVAVARGSRRRESGSPTSNVFERNAITL